MSQAHFQKTDISTASLIANLASDSARPHLRVRCIKQAGPGEGIEKVPVVGIISRELQSPRIHIYVLLHSFLDLVELPQRLS
jgi:hypothetical protein